jgi:zinc/manganese transport system substrate-binding protein
MTNGLMARGPRRARRRFVVGAVTATSAGVLALTACATSSGARPGSGRPSGGTVITVVATTNAWGSIAAQLGGTHVRETSLITNPDTDPHDYEPTPADARTIAGAQVVVKNGVGYDPWADKLLAANPVPGRVVLDVGELVHVPDGGNPHRWYSPPDVRTVADQITADYTAADPADAAYFDAQQQTFLTQGLARYNQLISDIKATYAGTPVGASESIFSPLAAALGLSLITPPSFLKAISEGTDVSPADKATIDQQIATGAIKVYVFNSQNSTPDVAAQVTDAKQRGIPVSALTETLTPATASFQDWQSAQLVTLQAALHQATGR